MFIYHDGSDIFFFYMCYGSDHSHSMLSRFYGRLIFFFFKLYELQIIGFVDAKDLFNAMIFGSART